MWIIYSDLELICVLLLRFSILVVVLLRDFIKKKKNLVQLKKCFMLFHLYLNFEESGNG